MPISLFQTFLNLSETVYVFRTNFGCYNQNITDYTVFSSFYPQMCIVTGSWRRSNKMDPR